MSNKTCCLMVAMGLLIGCATDRARTQAEGTAVGAAGGAAAGAGVGALIGGLTGGKEGAKKWAAMGAGIGAGVGALGGLAYGTHVADQKEKFAKTEDYLDAVIQHAKEINEQIFAYNKQLGVDVRQLDMETDSLVRQYQQKVVRKSDLLYQAKKLEEKISESEKQHKIVKNEIEKQNEVLRKETQEGSVKADDVRLDIMRSEVGRLEKNKAALEQELGKLASLKTRVSV